MERLQEQSQCVLHDYVLKNKQAMSKAEKSTMFSASGDVDEMLSVNLHPDNDTRYEKLLMLLPTLRKVKNTTVEQIFFHDLIGSSAIRDIIGDIYRQ